MAVLEVVFGSSPLYQDNIQFRSGTAYTLTLDHAITADRTLTLPDVTDTVAVLGTAQTWTTLQTFNAGMVVHPTPAVTAANQSLNPAPTALVLTAANTKSFTAIAQNITLPSITPAANGAGITLTGLNLSQGAISNVADSEAITVKQLIITGAAGAALATGVYTWTGADITMPAQAANAAVNLAKGIKITGGAVAGAASATQIGIDITMAAATDSAITVNTGTVTIGTKLYFSNQNLILSDGIGSMKIRNVADSGYNNLTASVVAGASALEAPQVRGSGAANMTLDANSAVTDATERTLTIRVLNATANAWLSMITLTPNAANPVTTFGYGTCHSFTASVSANSQTLNAAPAATTLTAVDTKSFTATGHHMVLSAITPAANGGGITMTGINLTQGAIANVADTETITVTQLAITGAAGVANETGIYTWTGISIITPAQAANAAVNAAVGLKVTCGAVAGDATAYQRGVEVTMAVNTQAGLVVLTGTASIGVAPYAALPASSLGVAGGVMVGADSTNNLIAAASTGAGSASLYIGNRAILVANGINFGPGAVASITVVNGQITAIS